MGIHIHIDFTPRQKRVMRAAVVAGVVIGALGLGLAVAAPHQWKSNDTLAAADLNGLNVATYASPDGGTSQYSVGATLYCGATSTSFTGNVGGRVAAKKQCELACGNSPTAHMCTYDEIARSRALGIPLSFPSGATCEWYSASAPQYYFGSGYGVVDDCAGWTSPSGAVNGGHLGQCWEATGDGSGLVWCNTQLPIACCD